MAPSAAPAVERLPEQRVTMRDGVHLATDVYLPAGSDGPLPVLLERTPYDRRGVSRSERSLAEPQPLTRAELARRLAAHGYAVVMQDCRGRHGSEGRFEKYRVEGADGCDTLAWLRKQPWCNGRIGTMGMSYGAHTQLALACHAPPGLEAMFIDSGGFASAYAAGIRRGGAFELKQATWAHRHALRSPATAADPARRAALEAVDLAAAFRAMPWTPGHSPLAAAPEYEDYLFEQWRHGVFDDYWRAIGLYAEGHYERIPDIPVAILGSWYDPYAGTCIRNYLGLAGRGAPVRLVMGPWTHGDRSQTHAGDVDFGPDSTLDGNIAADYLDLRLAWFDACLRDAGPVKGGVRWFEMGAGSGQRDAAGRLQHGGRWRSAAHWPPAAAQPLELFLGPGRRLQAKPPAAPLPAVAWRSDPADPVPTIGGAITSGEPLMRGGAFDQRVTPAVFCCREDHPQIPLAERADVLVFETAPLAQDLVVTGEVSAELWISSDAPDTDITIKLVDVYPPGEDLPEGFAMNVCDGILRLRHRAGFEAERFLAPGAVVPVRVACLPTSNRFRAGHRLRLDIASSSYPQFDINFNSGAPAGEAGEARVANNRLHLGSEHPSLLRLPVMAADDAPSPAAERRPARG